MFVDVLDEISPHLLEFTRLHHSTTSFIPLVAIKLIQSFTVHAVQCLYNTTLFIYKENMKKQQPAPRDALMPEGEVVETIEKSKKEKKKEEPMARNGLVYPALAWIFSTSFSSIAGAADGLSAIREIAFIFLGVGAYAMIAATIQSMCFEICAHHASRSFRLQWFEALLRQDCAFFDVYDVSGIAATIGGNSSKYRRGVGSKFGEFLQYNTNFVGGLVFAFYSSWKVALVVLAVLPIVGLTGLAAVQINTTKSASAAAAYSKAGSVAYSIIALFLQSKLCYRLMLFLK